MGKIIAFLIISSLFIANAYAISTEDLREAENWFESLSRRKEKVAKIHFYTQDALGGPNATVWEVARAAITAESPTMFGRVSVVDDLITAEPDRNSEKLGRAQGLITSADLSESALAATLNIVFKAGEYNGSSISFAGWNPLTRPNRELPIVGGTGIFRMARGFSISNPYSFDPVANYGVLESTVYVSYYV